MARITKKQVLEGIKARKTVEVPEMGGEFTVRPLNDGEFSEMQNETARLSKESKAFFQKNSKKTPEEIEAMVQADPTLQEIITPDDMFHLKESTYITAAGGLSCDGETWTVEDVKQMPSGVPDKLSKVILDMSTGEKGGKAEAARSFRKERGGAENDTA